MTRIGLSGWDRHQPASHGPCELCAVHRVCCLLPITLKENFILTQDVKIIA
jgi:hypothetical protein